MRTRPVTVSPGGESLVLVGDPVCASAAASAQVTRRRSFTTHGEGCARAEGEEGSKNARYVMNDGLIYQVRCLQLKAAPPLHQSHTDSPHIGYSDVRALSTSFWPKVRSWFWRDMRDTNGTQFVWGKSITVCLIIRYGKWGQRAALTVRRKAW